MMSSFSVRQMFLKAFIFGSLVGIVLGTSPRTSTYANTTFMSSTRAHVATASNCCFVVQDTITERWWQEYATIYQVVNLTSISTLITLYADTKVTNHETNVYKTNASYAYTVGRNPASLLNQAPHLVEATVSLHGSRTTTAGATIHSPTAFWVYSTIKVIVAPAVTNPRGQIVCATRSTIADAFSTNTILGVNSNAEVYFSGGNNTHHSKPPGVIITLPTPYVYFPTRGAPGRSLHRADYGYVPQSVVDYIKKVPVISSQYPGLESCLPGGPSIEQAVHYHDKHNNIQEVSYQTLAPDLTRSTVITISSSGSLNHVYYSVGVPISPTTLASTATELPVGIISIIDGVTPGANLLPPSNPTPTRGFVTPGSDTIAVNVAFQLSDSTTVVSGQESVVHGDPKSLPDNLASSPHGSTASILGAPVTKFAGSITVPINPSIHLSGRTTTISGSLFVIVAAPTTASQLTHSLLDSTKSISGTPVVSKSRLPSTSATSVSGLTAAVGGLTKVAVSETKNVEHSPTATETGVTGGVAQRWNSQGWWWGATSSALYMFMSIVF